MKAIFSAYRKGDYADPDGFVVQLGSVLEGYPEWVVSEVSHPKTGIQRKLKFPPSIAEVVEACGAAHAPILRAQERATAVEKQLAERAQWEAQQRANPAPARAGKIITYREYVESYEPNGAKVTGSVYRHDGGA